MNRHSSSKRSDGHPRQPRIKTTEPEILAWHAGAPPKPANDQKRSLPAFFGWPSFLYEKLLNPWGHVTSMVDWMDSWQVGNRLVVPKSAIRETAAEYIYAIDLPGIVREQIALNFQNGVMMLKVKETKSGKRSTHMRAISRAFTLPFYADVEHIKAAFQSSVLTITIPKTDKPSWPRTHSIAVA